jgi:hypothetical protein
MAATLDLLLSEPMRNQMNEANTVRIGFPVPASSAEGNGNHGMEVIVIHTNDRGTQSALKTAGGLAYDLGARIKLIALQGVHWSLPLTRPSVPVRWTEQRLFDLVCAAASPQLDTDIHVYLCRHKQKALLNVLHPKSLVVIGHKKTWWPSQATRMAAMLERAGHRVIYADHR